MAGYEDLQKQFNKQDVIYKNENEYETAHSSAFDEKFSTPHKTALFKASVYERMTDLMQDGLTKEEREKINAGKTVANAPQIQAPGHFEKKSRKTHAKNALSNIEKTQLLGEGNTLAEKIKSLEYLEKAEKEAVLASGLSEDSLEYAQARYNFLRQFIAAVGSAGPNEAEPYIDKIQKAVKELEALKAQMHRMNDKLVKKRRADYLKEITDGNPQADNVTYEYVKASESVDNFKFYYKKYAKSFLIQNRDIFNSVSDTMLTDIKERLDIYGLLDFVEVDKDGNVAEKDLEKDKQNRKTLEAWIKGDYDNLKPAFEKFLTNAMNFRIEYKGNKIENYTNDFSQIILQKGYSIGFDKVFRNKELGKLGQRYLAEKGIDTDMLNYFEGLSMAGTDLFFTILSPLLSLHAVDNHGKPSSQPINEGGFEAINKSVDSYTPEFEKRIADAKKLASKDDPDIEAEDFVNGLSSLNEPITIEKAKERYAKLQIQKAEKKKSDEAEKASRAQKEAEEKKQKKIREEKELAEKKIQEAREKAEKEANDARAEKAEVYDSAFKLGLNFNSDNPDDPLGPYFAATLKKYQFRSLKLTNTKSRLYAKQQNMTSLKSLAEAEEFYKMKEYPGITAEESLAQVKEDIQKLYAIDLSNLDLSTDTAFVASSQQISDVLSLKKFINDRVKNLGETFFDSVSDDEFFKFNRTMKKLNALGEYYTARCKLLTHPYYASHYNGEMATQVDGQDTEEERTVCNLINALKEKEAALKDTVSDKSIGSFHNTAISELNDIFNPGQSMKSISYNFTEFKGQTWRFAFSQTKGMEVPNEYKALTQTVMTTVENDSWEATAKINQALFREKYAMSEFTIGEEQAPIVTEKVLSLVKSNEDMASVGITSKEDIATFKGLVNDGLKATQKIFKLKVYTTYAQDLLAKFMAIKNDVTADPRSRETATDLSEKFDKLSNLLLLESKKYDNSIANRRMEYEAYLSKKKITFDGDPKKMPIMENLIDDANQSIEKDNKIVDLSIPVEGGNAFSVKIPDIYLQDLGNLKVKKAEDAPKVAKLLEEYIKERNLYSSCIIVRTNFASNYTFPELKGMKDKEILMFMVKLRGTEHELKFKELESQIIEKASEIPNIDKLSKEEMEKLRSDLRAKEYNKESSPMYGLYTKLSSAYIDKYQLGADDQNKFSEFYSAGVDINADIASLDEAKLPRARKYLYG